MTRQRDQLVLGLAFAVALLLHALALPWAGQAVGRVADRDAGDLVLDHFASDPSIHAGERIEIDYAWHLDTDGALDQYALRFEVFLSRGHSIDEGAIHLINQRSCPLLTGRPAKGRDTIEPRYTEGLDGPYQLICRIGLEGDIVDPDRSNNTRSAAIYVDGPQTPELTIDTLHTPDHALPGGSILIDYTVKNTGQGWANAPGRGVADRTANWTDRVYLSADGHLDDTDLPLRSFERTAPLKPGGAYRHESVELAIPRGVTGRAYLILAADSGQVLDQPSFTAGLVVKPIELIDTHAPDLVVASIREPERLVIGRPTPVTFSVANLGSGATDTAGWADRFYLAPEPVLDSRAVPVGVVQAREPLAPRSRYATTTRLTLPESVEPGMQYLIVHTDGDDAIDEPGFEDNNTLAVPVMVMTQQQADAEIQLGKPENPERLVVQWIEHDVLNEHRARLSRTVQPALQDKADPTPNAPLNFDPTPPSVAQRPSPAAGNPTKPNRTADPAEQQDARPAPTPTDATQSDLTPRAQQQSSPLTPRIDGLPGDDGELPSPRPGLDLPIPPTDLAPPDPTPGPNDTPSPIPGQRDIDSTANPEAPETDRITDSKTPSEQDAETDSKNPDETPNPTPTDQLAKVEADDSNARRKTEEPVKEPGEGDADQKQTQKTTTPKPAEDQTKQPDGKDGKPAEAAEPSDPTRVARDDSEAPPTNNRLVEVKLQEGRVLVGEGIEVTTKLPTLPGIGSRRFSLPRNARVRVTFDKEGKVYEAKMLRSTRYKEWDAAIEASLYRWSARGKAVDEAEPYISIEWDYILNELLDEEP